jgi:hypothetical protein
MTKIGDVIAMFMPISKDEGKGRDAYSLAMTELQREGFTFFAR